MCAKQSRITLSLSKELLGAIDLLSDQCSMSRSRLVETCLREHQNIQKCVFSSRSQTQFAAVQTVCSICRINLKGDEIKIDTPKYGTVCMRCWAKKMGEYIETNPVSDT